MATNIKDINLIIIAMEEELSCLLEQIEYQTIKVGEETRYIFTKNNRTFFWQLYGTSFTMWCGDWTDSVLL